MMIPKTIKPAQARDQTWDIIKGTPNVEYWMINGELYRVVLESHHAA